MLFVAAIKKIDIRKLMSYLVSERLLMEGRAKKMKTYTKRQQEIINASIQLIARDGIQQLTIKNLAGELGITDGAIYRHFKSKMDILLGILDQFRGSKSRALGQVRQDESSEIEKLRHFFLQRFKQFSTNPALTAVIFSEEIFQNDKQLAREVFDIMISVQNNILQIIEKGQQNGNIRDDLSSTSLSMMFIGTLRFIVTKWHLSGFDFNLEQEGQKLWNDFEKLIKS